MRTIASIFLLFGILINISSSCNKKDENDECIYKTSEGYIIGFDPCTDIDGFIIVTSDLKDTLSTYSLTDTLFSIPEIYFSNSGGLFPDTARYEYKIEFDYKFTPEEEMIYISCPANIIPVYGWYFFNRQIIIKSVQKIN